MMDHCHWYFFIVLYIMSFVLGSYNSRGLGPGRMDYITELSTKCDFLLIQEHWLLCENLGTFHSIPNISCHGVSAMDSSQVLAGRPHGGCSILWKNSLSCKVTPVESGNLRSCSVLVELPTLKFLIVNFYLPVDTRHDRENDREFNQILSDASAIAEKLGVDHVIYGGDFNTDFSRSTSLHTISLNRFISREVIHEPPGNIDYTYENVVSGDRSCIDHFFTTENLTSFVELYECAHDADNFSDHSPIFLRLGVPVDHVTSGRGDRLQRLCWDRAASSIPHY